MQEYIDSMEQYKNTVTFKHPGIPDHYKIEQYDRSTIEREYHDNGLWTERIIAYIPLNKIDYARSSDSQIVHNMEHIRTKQTIHPVILHYDTDVKKYIVDDGNHRCWCCAYLGYTHIPAIVETKNSIQPFDDETMAKLRMSNTILHIMNKNMSDRLCDLLFNTYSYYINGIDGRNATIILHAPGTTLKNISIHAHKNDSNGMDYYVDDNKKIYHNINDVVISAHLH